MGAHAGFKKKDPEWRRVRGGAGWSSKEVSRISFENIVKGREGLLSAGVGSVDIDVWSAKVSE